MSIAIEKGGKDRRKRQRCGRIGYSAQLEAHGDQSLNVGRVTDEPSAWQGAPLQLFRPIDDDDERQRLGGLSLQEQKAPAIR